ncbi:hypothetical protein ACLOJK_041470 [Asimina triloba]
MGVVFNPYTNLGQKIDSHLQLLQDLIRQINEKMGKIESELYAIVLKSNDMAATAEVIRTKEKEKKSLQYQLNSIQSEPSPTSGYFPWSHKTMYTPNYQPQPLLPPSLMSQAPPPKSFPYEWRPKPTPPSTTLSVPATVPVATVPDKGKSPMTPIPEYILES